MEEDPCILCGEKTGYTKNTPVDQRENYVEGAGQLCPECDALVYKKKPSPEPWMRSGEKSN